MGIILSWCFPQSKVQSVNDGQPLPDNSPPQDQKARDRLVTDELKLPTKPTSYKVPSQRNHNPQSRNISVIQSNQVLPSQRKNVQSQRPMQQTSNFKSPIPTQTNSQQPLHKTTSIQMTHSQQIPTQPLLTIQNVRNQQPKNPSKIKIEYRDSSKQLIERQKKLKNSSQYLKAQKKQSNIEELIQIAGQCHELQLYTEQKNFCLQALSKVQQIQKNYSIQSIAQIKAHIFSQLVNAVIAQNTNEIQADKYFKQAIESYDKTIQVATIEERIALLNNYSVFKRNRGNPQASKLYLQEAIKLMENYFVVSDQRKYLALINLACLDYETTRRPQKVRSIQQRINRQCKNQEIIGLANNNLSSYK